MNEVDSPPADIEWKGPLHGGSPNFKVWSGGISLDKLRLDRDKFFRLKEVVDSYFVPVDSEGSIRCIDGRWHVGTADRQREDIATDKLGPQTPGGSPGAALAFRLANFRFKGNGGKKLTDDMLYATLQYNEQGLPFPVGTHEDDHAEDPFTGCGAIDRLPEILEKMSDEEAQPIIHQYVRAIVGADYDDGAYEKVVHRVQSMLKPKFQASYLEQRPDGEYDYRKKTLEATRHHGGHEVCEVMEGQHKEAVLVVNMQAGETFHRDLLCFDIENEAQVFNYDYWASVERANALYGDKEFRRQKFLIARAMYAVATAMVLTDGSLELGIRK